MRTLFASRRTRAAAWVIVIALPVLLGAFSYFQKMRPTIRYGVEYTFWDHIVMNLDLILAAVFLMVSAVPFLLVFDRRKPQARELVPIAVMAALCVVGRTVFAIVPLPNFKPVSAIIIIAAIVFGPETGFLTGALGGFVSNFIFGQGPWTPWQMFTWGIIGFLAGLLKNAGCFKTVGRVEAQPTQHFTAGCWDRLFPPGSTRGDLLAFVRTTTDHAPMGLCLFGLFTGFLYGWVMNLYMVAGYVNPLTWQAVGAVYLSSIFFDLSHGVCTFLVLWALASPWCRKLERVKVKFGLIGEARYYAMPPSPGAEANCQDNLSPLGGGK